VLCIKMFVITPFARRNNAEETVWQTYNKSRAYRKNANSV